MVKYIGQSMRGMRRPRDHAKTLHRLNRDERAWIEDLQAVGLDYDITVLEYVDDPKGPAIPRRAFWDTRMNVTRLNDAEIWWIAYGRACGWPLLNYAVGGCGRKGVVVSPDARARLSATMLGKGDDHHSRRPEFKAAMARRFAAGDSPLCRPDVIARRIAATTGDRSAAKRPETRAKMLASLFATFAARPPATSVCGTRSAYLANVALRRAGKPHCGPCRECSVASRDYMREWRARHPAPIPRAVSPCGTRASYLVNAALRRAGAPNCGPCAACRAGSAAYMRGYRETR